MRSILRITRFAKRWLTAALAAAALAVLSTGCESLFARGNGGSETGVDNAEFGIRF